MYSTEDSQTANCQAQECIQVSFLICTKKCQWMGGKNKKKHGITREHNS
jgi:hypothetical protein